MFVLTLSQSLKGYVLGQQHVLGDNLVDFGFSLLAQLVVPDVDLDYVLVRF